MPELPQIFQADAQEDDLAQRRRGHVAQRQPGRQRLLTEVIVRFKHHVIFFVAVFPAQFDLTAEDKVKTVGFTPCSKMTAFSS